MRYSCVLFDLDNTLLYRTPSVTEKVFEALSRHFPQLDMADIERAYAEGELWTGEQVKREIESGVRMGDDEFFGNLLSFYKTRCRLPDDVSLELLLIVAGRYERTYVAAPGADAVLEGLRAAGVRLGVVSNNSAGVRGTLAELGLLRHFGCVVISEEVGVCKPDPAILLLACERLRVPCREAVYVGDHPFDVLCAHSAGMAAAWLPPNPYFTIPAYVREPEHILSKLTDLLGMLQ